MTGLILVWTMIAMAIAACGALTNVILGDTLRAGQWAMTCLPLAIAWFVVLGLRYVVKKTFLWTFHDD